MTHPPHSLKVRFWGVRGSIPTPSPENLGYGGNTSCIEIRTATNILVFDLGTGARKLGESLIAEHVEKPMTLHVFLTHYHWDHLQGLPLFGPLYNPGNTIIFHAPAQLGSIRERLRGQMTAPYFPVDFNQVPAHVELTEIGDEPIVIGDIEVHSFPMHHPQGAFGYRVQSAAAVVVYASDREHGNEESDAKLREVAKDVDVLIYDSQYTPEEYVSHVGWGHSNWMEAARVANVTGAKKLVLFHHDPSHDDATMDRIQSDTRKDFANTVAAREGLEIEVP